MVIDGPTLRLRAERTFGKAWRERLANDIGVSRGAVNRWANSGVTGERGDKLNALLRKSPRPTLIERFSEWRQTRFASTYAASVELGIDKDTIHACETGITKNGNEFAPPAWLEFVMIGYDYVQRPHGQSLSEVETQLLLADARSGKFNYTELQEKYLIGPTKLYNLLAEHEIVLERARRGYPLQIDLEAAKEAIERLQDLAAVAAEIGHAYQTILYHQKRGRLPLTNKQIARAAARAEKKPGKRPSR